MPQTALTLSGGQIATFQAATATDISALKIVPGLIYGLTLSNDTTTPTTIIDVAVGSAADSTNVAVITLGSIFKKTVSAFVAGSGNGGLDTGTVAASKWYHVLLISNAAGTLVDILFSLSPTAPTLPSGYTLFRRIGSFYYNATPRIQAFSQNGNEFLWTSPTSDIVTSGSIAASTQVTYTAQVPTGIKVNALVAGYANCATASATLQIYSTDISVRNAVANIALVIVAASDYNYCNVNVRTSTTGTFYAYGSSAFTAVNLGTVGWIDTRGSVVISGGSTNSPTTIINANPLPVATTAYTLALTDAGMVVESTASAAVNITIPPVSTVAFPVGTFLWVFQYGSGQVTIAAGAGVTIDTPSSLTTKVQNATIKLRQRATNEWVVSGNLT